MDINSQINIMQNITLNYNPIYAGIIQYISGWEILIVMQILWYSMVQKGFDMKIRRIAMVFVLNTHCSS